MTTAEANRAWVRAKLQDSEPAYARVLEHSFVQLQRELDRDQAVTYLRSLPKRRVSPCEYATY